ncbi:hypothetical protein BFP72_07660 [Reichenbachiella sp. 5M10]|uniref:DUF2589 domain-containing protein n=1 Tax=Reichenbachiella sp. 5M10 TaxID=1889772 RepID=UPI000C4D2390|nr:DUF2589 domain-containing protein [Reichenbachiella sp. 5M10]PIB35283.1 hypothetical protein BFP72_07660 [Reichenbachiella sp. 5M10]
MEIANQFKGLPMETLIGGPLKAACDANVLMAQATSSFINDVGFLPEQKGADGKMVPGAPRMVDFTYEKPGTDQDGKPAIELVKVKVPILAIVPIPNLQVNTVNVTFDMEVKSSSSSRSQTDASASLTASAKFGFGPVSGSVSISGSVSTSKENTRSSDQSAKYHVDVNAQNFGMPEGLARVLDMMNQAAAPRQIEQYKAKDGEIERDKDGKIIGKPTLVDSTSKPIEDDATSSSTTTK